MSGDNEHKDTANAHTRIDDLKDSISNYIHIFITVFVFAAGLAGVSVFKEWERLENFKTELTNKVDEKLNLVDADPDLEYYAFDHNPLQGNIVNAAQHIASVHSSYLSFGFSIKNVGASTTKAIRLKLYTNEPITLSTPASEKNGFAYENDWGAKTTFPQDIPPGLSTNCYAQYVMNRSEAINEGTYPVMLKVFYGDSEVDTVKFELSFKENKNYYHHSNFILRPDMRPNILLLDKNGLLLHGQEIDGYVFDISNGVYGLCISFQEKNIGSLYKGESARTLFSSDPIKLKRRNYEIAGYDYQSDVKRKQYVHHHGITFLSADGFLFKSDEKPAVGSTYPLSFRIVHSNNQLGYWKFKVRIVEEGSVEFQCRGR